MKLGLSLGLTKSKKQADAPGPDAGSGLLLEDGTSFLLLEDGSFLLLES